MSTLTVDFSTRSAVVKFFDASCNKNMTACPNAEEAARLAIRDYQRLIDSIVEVRWVHDYDGNDYRSAERDWITIKVLKDDPNNVLDGDQDILYPRYDVEVIDGKGIIQNGAAGWIFGRSYDLSPDKMAS